MFEFPRFKAGYQVSLTYENSIQIKNTVILFPERRNERERERERKHDCIKSFESQVR